MSGASEAGFPEERPARALLWGAAGALALAGHLGAAWFLLHLPATAVPPESPAALMIELAPVPEAVRTGRMEIASEEPAMPAADTAEPAEADPEPLQDMAGEQVAEPDAVPPEDTPKERPLAVEPEEAEAADIPSKFADANVPLPRERPERSPAKPAKSEQPRSKTSAAPSAAAPARPQAQVRRSDRNAASQTVSGRSATVSPARWQARLLAHLERHKRYPPGARRRREEGTAVVRFTIDTAGKVLSVRLARSSGFPELDAEVVAMVRRASPVPAPPPGVSRTITAPVRFAVR